MANPVSKAISVIDRSPCRSRSFARLMRASSTYRWGDDPVAPALYLVHAVLAGTAQFLMATLGAHMGFTFSQGGIDFVLFNVLNPASQKWWLVLILGPVYAGIYYATFRGMISWLNLKTPGREAAVKGEEVPKGAVSDRAQRLVAAFGGGGNLASLDACITRLRIAVVDPARVDKPALEALGASAVFMVGQNVQAIFGPLSENLKTEMELYLKSGAGLAAAAPVAAPTKLPSQPPRPVRQPESWAVEAAPALLASLGGKPNLGTVEVVALTRLRVELKEPGQFDEAAARQAGVLGVMTIRPGVLHLIVGEKADQLALALGSGG